MKWIDNGFDLVWDKVPPVARELKNSKSSTDNEDFIIKAISEMLEFGAASILLSDVRPTVYSPLEKY
jgi:hypothetical protein